jgi:hypothetical protein
MNKASRILLWRNVNKLTNHYKGIAMGQNVHVATVVGCCAFAGLVPPRSPKLGLAYLKTEAR